jgi:hypothetical protein
LSSDDQFTALGPAPIGFQTNASAIDRGAEIAGTSVGVLGRCDTPGGPEAVGIRGMGAALGGGNAPTAISTPTTGVLGTGGRRDDFQNHDRGPHGAGVVGVAGVHPPQQGQTIRQVPPFEDTAHVGVFGLGGEGESRQTGSGAGPSGPLYSGPGVLGRGGEYRDFSGPASKYAADRGGVGVAGVSGGQEIPVHYEMWGVGVFGKGLAAGVRGVSTEVLGRGGIFSCASAAQVRLQPHEVPINVPTTDVTPKGFVVGELDEAPPANLPIHGLPGDLLTTTSGIGKDEKTTLWFCQRGQKRDPSENPRRHAALWREVLMGPAFPGTIEDA